MVTHGHGRGVQRSALSSVSLNNESEPNNTGEYPDLAVLLHKN